MTTADKGGVKRVQRSSYGLACFRRTHDAKLQLLVINKRYTYQFYDFVYALYNNHNDTNEMLRLMSFMTYDEKLIIAKLDFAKMWYLIWLSDKHNVKYSEMKKIFERNFIEKDRGARLLTLLAKSAHGTRAWEIPKGRKKSTAESDLDCAIREFTEETHMNRADYHIIPNAKITHKYVSSDRVEYVITIFFAFSHVGKDPALVIDNGLYSNYEIFDIMWMNKKDIMKNDKSGHISSIIKPAFNYTRKYCKNKFSLCL